MKTKHITFACRPKTNSSYTAKKATMLAVVDIPEDINTDKISSDNLSVITKQDLVDLRATVGEFLKSKCDALETSLKSTKKDIEENFNVAKVYAWYEGQADAYRNAINEMASFIGIGDTLRGLIQFCDLNSNIELIAFEGYLEDDK